MAVNWTPQQLRAITSRGHAILVSAAAGSGKTAVLVERIIRYVCDENDPHDIDKFLIVTFTKAAAAEMRGKISDALTAKLLEDPHSRRLRNQLSKLSHACIMTVDSFCTMLLREYFQEAGVSPDFRVCDESEASAIQNEMFEELIERKYEESQPDSDFLLLVDALSAARDDSKLRRTILDCYRKIQSHPFPERWIARNIEELEKAASMAPEMNIYGRELITRLCESAEYHERELKDACALMEEDEKVRGKYMPAFSDDLEHIRAIIDACKGGGWNEIHAAVFEAMNSKSLSAVMKYPDKNFLEELKAIRKSWQKELEKYANGAFAHDADKICSDCAQSMPLCRALMETVQQFDEYYSAGKRARNVMDFADLEHFALKILIDSYGEDGFTPSDIARELSQRFDEIAVDEFQDTNEVQDLLYRVISKDGSNLFMVGDVKQSIYSFRLADPEVFLKKYHSYGEGDDCNEGERIILSQNFRSRREVIDSVNFIFESIFSASLGGIEYVGQEALVCGAQYPEAEEGACDSEFVILEDPQDGRGKTAYEADYIASRIRDMIAQGYPVTDRASGALRPCRADDFAILLRSVKNRAIVYADALKKASIPVFTESTTDLFRSLEIMTLMSLCEVIDNPDQDVELACVLHSPIYAYTADELAQVRISDKKVSFYSALKKAAEAETELGGKCRAVLSQIAALRRDSREMSADRLLIRMIQQTGFISRFSAACPDDFSRANINAFIAAAARSENSGYHGLYAFLNLMRSVRDGKGMSSPSGNGSGVHISTIHKSKGLEYPIVFVSELDSKFNMSDLTDTVLIHPQLGAGFKYRPKGRMIEYPTLMRHAISGRMRLEQLSEQMRVFYVALTRAKEKLILVAAGKADALVGNHMRTSLLRPIDPRALSAHETPLSWLFAPMLRLPCAAEMIQNAQYHRAPLEDDDRSFRLIVDTPAPADAEDSERSRETPHSIPLEISPDELYARLDFKYENPAVNIPSKLTATGLKGRYADEESREQAVDMVKTAKAARRRPRALTQQSMTGAQKGTALHMAMQFLDYSRTDSPEAIDAQIREMAEKRLLSAEAADSIDRKRLLAFFRGELGRRLALSDKVSREFKFSILASSRIGEDISALAERPADGEDTVLFQGVIDCFFEDESGITVIDFKSDRVSDATVADACENYAPQLRAYRYALERITGKPVRAAYLYFFALDEGICVE